MDTRMWTMWVISPGFISKNRICWLEWKTEKCLTFLNLFLLVIVIFVLKNKPRECLSLLIWSLQLHPCGECNCSFGGSLDQIGLLFEQIPTLLNSCPLHYGCQFSNSTFSALMLLQLMGGYFYHHNNFGGFWLLLLGFVNMDRTMNTVMPMGKMGTCITSESSIP